MKKGLSGFRAVLVLFLILTGSASAEIREVQSIAEVTEIHKKVDQETLVILDVDNTLITAEGNLGSDQWFYYLFKVYKMAGIDEKRALVKAVDTWNRVQSSIHVRAVEKAFPVWVNQLQADGVRTLALTARGEEISDITSKQLQSIEVRFKGRSLVDHELKISGKSLESKADALFREGILFVGENNDKGKVLVHFLRRVGYSPKKIIFVDDKVKHVNNMEAAVKALGIPCFNYRYGAWDAQVKMFYELTAEATNLDLTRLLFLGA